MTGKKIIAKNKKAHFNFQLEERVEAGMVLKGTEVKSIKLGKLSLEDAFITIDQDEEAWVYNMHVAHYAFGNINNHEEMRKRKLLLKKEEIVKLAHAIKAGGYTIVPTIIYFSKNRIKLELALAKGKKAHDKRADEVKKDIEKKLRRGNYDV